MPEATVPGEFRISAGAVLEAAQDVLFGYNVPASTLAHAILDLAIGLDAPGNDEPGAPGNDEPDERHGYTA